MILESMESIYHADWIDVCNQLNSNCLSMLGNDVGMLNANMCHEGMQMNNWN